LQFGFDFKEDGETTEREILTLEWQRSGRVPWQFELQLPRPLAYLWDWWQALAPTRPSGMGLSGIAYQEIESWARLTGRSVEAWEIDALRRIDNLYLDSKGRQMQADHERAEHERDQQPKIQIARR